MTKLYPTIETIEQRLFSPSDNLISKWISNDPSVSNEKLKALENNSLALEKRNAYKDIAVSDIDIHSEAIKEFSLDDTFPIRSIITDNINKRLLTTKYFHDVSEPAPGQIRLIEKATGPDGDLNWDINHPLFVLLWHETEDEGVWYGWMAANEPDYACEWDILLEEEDEPYDPYVKMIQLWNPLHIYIPTTSKILGKLSHSRLETLSTAFTDFLTEDIDLQISTKPGSLVERVISNGDSIMTGTPMDETGDDPRIRYQDLYFAASGFVKDIAKLAVDALEERTELSSDRPLSWSEILKPLWDTLSQALDDRFGPVQPVYADAIQSGAENSEDNFLPEIGQWAKFLKVSMVSIDKTNSVKLEIENLSEDIITISLFQDGDFMEQHELKNTKPVQLIFRLQPNINLEISYQGTKYSCPMNF